MESEREMMLTNQPQFGVWHSIGLVYRYIAIYDEMCEWWDKTLEIQEINRKR